MSLFSVKPTLKALAIGIMMSLTVPRALAGGGILLERTYPFDTSISVVEPFSELSARGNDESGYMMFFADLKGKRKGVDKRLVVEIVEFDDFSNVSEISSEQALAPLIAEQQRLSSIIAKVPIARPYIGPHLAEIVTEIERFREGSRKVKGRWLSKMEYAAEQRRIADEGAAEERRIADEHAAEERRVVDERAAEERRVADERAAGEKKKAIELRKSTDAVGEGHLSSGKPQNTSSVYLSSVSDFKEKVQLFWARIVHDPAATQAPTSLANLGEFPEQLKADIGEFDAAARAFRKNVGYEVSLNQCATETAQIDMAVALSAASHSLKAGAASAARQSIDNFFAVNQGEWKNLEPVRSTLLNVRNLSATLVRDSQAHLDKARKLEVEGKHNEAIKECEIAYSVLPDPEIPVMIKKLQAESLGL